MFKTKIPPPIFALLYGFVAWFLAKTIPLYHIDPMAGNTLAIIFLLAGLGMASHALVSFFRERTTFSPHTPEKSKTLVVTGFYSYTRNPMYLGLLCVLISASCFMGAISAFLVLPLFVVTMNYCQIVPEEQALAEIFGDAYLQYKNNVRRWL